MIAISPTSLTRVAGVLLGIGVAVVLVMSSRPSASFARLPASVSISIRPTGELELTPSPPRPLLVARSLTPGSTHAARRLTIRNQTAVTLQLGFRAHAQARGLDGLLRIRLRAGAATLADTTLQGLRRGSASSLRLPSGGVRALALEVWLAAGTTGYEGRSAAIELAPTLRARG